MNVTYLNYKPGNPLFGPNHKEIIDKFFNDVDIQMKNPKDEIFKIVMTSNELNTLSECIKALGVINPNDLLSPWTRPSDVRVEGFIHDHRDDQYDEEQCAVSLYFHLDDSKKSHGFYITFVNYVDKDKWFLRTIKANPVIIGTYPLAKIEFDLNFRSPGLNSIDVTYSRYNDKDYMDANMDWAMKVRLADDDIFSADKIKQNISDIINREKNESSPTTVIDQVMAGLGNLKNS